MQELEAGRGGGGADWTELSDDEEELEARGGEQLDVLFEKERSAVRRAGWLAFKALLAVNKDRKLEVVARRKWRRHWVTLKGEKNPVQTSPAFNETNEEDGGVFLKVHAARHEITPLAL